jgi:hypothetical protein
MSSSSALHVLYDLRVAETCLRVHQHRKLSGKLYTDYHFLDQDRVVLVFRSGGARWVRWEEAQKRIILGKRVAACSESTTSPPAASSSGSPARSRSQYASLRSNSGGWCRIGAKPRTERRRGEGYSY